jgi:hypothetical protein
MSMRQRLVAPNPENRDGRHEMSELSAGREPVHGGGDQFAVRAKEKANGQDREQSSCARLTER